MVPHPRVDTPAHARADCTCAGVSQGEEPTLAFQILWIRLLTLIWMSANHRKTSQWWRQLCCDPPQLQVPHPKRAGPQRGRYLNTQQVIARPQILALWTFDSLLTDRTGRMQLVFAFQLMLYTLITFWWWPWGSWVWDLLAVVPKAYSHILETSRWDLFPSSFHLTGCNGVSCVFVMFRKALKMIRAALSAFLVLVVACTDGKYIPKTGKRIPQTLSRGLFHSLRLMAEWWLCRTSITNLTSGMTAAVQVGEISWSGLRPTKRLCTGPGPGMSSRLAALLLMQMMSMVKR